MSKELKLFAYVAAGLFIARAAVLLVDAIAESVERTALRG